MVFICGAGTGTSVDRYGRYLATGTDLPTGTVPYLRISVLTIPKIFWYGSGTYLNIGTATFGINK